LLCELLKPSTRTCVIVFWCAGGAPQNHITSFCRVVEDDDPLSPLPHPDSATAAMAVTATALRNRINFPISLPPRSALMSARAVR